MANTVEPENDQSCWEWLGKRDGWWYGRLNVYVPGLGDTRTVMAHVASWVCHQAAPTDADDFWLAYLELNCSGLEIDHLCTWPCCVNVDHLEPVTPSENSRRRDARRGLGFSLAPAGG
jgi:hypothetical protein